MPWVYLLAGRYALYYTWAAYIPCIIALFVLLQQQVKCLKTVTSVLVLCSVSYFVFSGNHNNWKKIDLHREADARNMQDIASLNIADDESIYIPYEWYYYLALRNSHLYFRGSGRYVKRMKRMVLSSDKEIEDWNRNLELEYMYDIGSRKVYKVLGDYGKNSLKDIEKQ